LGAVENETAKGLFGLIDNHSVSVADAVKTALAAVKESLVNAAINGDLPADFNDIDLLDHLEQPRVAEF
jgi:hypothetical protein